MVQGAYPGVVLGMTGMWLASAAEGALMMVLVQLVVIIAVARVFSGLFKKMGQPAVVGEIVAGLMLGPSVFGKIEVLLGYRGHEISGWLFDARVNDTMQILSQLGLIMLLFLVGLEFDFKHLKTSSRAAMSISVAGVVLPFALGMGVAYWMHPLVMGVKAGATQPMAATMTAATQGAHEVSSLGFALFMGTAMSITALPILGRMMMEFGITRTRIGAVTITAAAMDDATGWIVLAAVSALVQSHYDPMGTLKMIALTAGFAAVVMFVGRPILGWWIRTTLAKHQGELGLNGLAVLLVVLFLCAIATSEIGIFAIFGAFILGAVLSDQHAFRETVGRQLRNLVTVFFLPIFFTYTGLRTDIGTLDSGWMWLIAGGVMAAAIAGKFGGCTLAARVGGFGWRESSCIGIMMNTRALMELIVINVGRKLGIIPDSVFCMLVMMAVLTTVMTTPILRWMQGGTELEEPMRASGFGRGGVARVG